MRQLLLFLGIFSLALAPFDLFLQGWTEALLPLAWGLFFLALAWRERLAGRWSQGGANGLLWVLGGVVVVAGVVKLLGRLGAMG